MVPHTSVIGGRPACVFVLTISAPPLTRVSPGNSQGRRFRSVFVIQLADRLVLGIEFGVGEPQHASGTHLPAGRLRASLCADGFLTTRPLRHRQVALSVIETDEWLTAQDAEGRTYYYHAVTMETSWTDPRVVVEEPAKPERQQLHALHVLPSNVDRDALSQYTATVETPWTKLKQKKPSGPS